MNPATRIAAVIGASTLTLAGAGFALATVGQASSASTDAPAETPVAATQQDGPNLNALARELSRLDDRSSHLAALLADTRARADQVAARNSTVVTPATAPAAPSTSSGSSSSSGHDDSDDSSHGSTGSYRDDDRDESYDDDAYEDDSDDDGDDHSEDSEHEDHEDESDDD
jgi:hypothetical protein